MKRLDYYWSSINFVSMMLLPLAGFYCFVSTLRKKLYKSGVLKSYKAPLPVIIVGNITVGGTGKTPLIIELVKQLQSRGRKPCVISRGYGGNASIWPQIVNDKSFAETVGDEPQLIFQNTGCPVVVGPNRKEDIELLIKQFDCDVVLSDDGLQHYALQRDIEISVVDAQRQFGNGFCLPSGPLRENVSRLKQLDMVLLNGGSDKEVSFVMLPNECVSVGKREADQLSLSNLSDKTVHAIAGIGNPDRFFQMLKAYNINVIPHSFEDHYMYKQTDLNFNDDCPVLMTEKDAIKCINFELSNHWSVPIEIKLSETAQLQMNQIFDSLAK
ncbi:MAG: tetraacyldisaccharide 4'-kinase [endosymbiont of Galathealinum brachiosum]|uniref:Tetraacyldisaccharide 4'-kinase n=1 Tax=endosymbiont of Galathealinum brachiosum TaxID=2200906 RepID=A0A370DGD4_9GAMM|nr:MAG: tetraacyldisaccharide 4'-kinase [endosymbiont of Galathealinum brachiosum]